MRHRRCRTRCPPPRSPTRRSRRSARRRGGSWSWRTPTLSRCSAGSPRRKWRRCRRGRHRR
eukprot:7230070-Prymnesium_polylepis.1